jgi:hypothetical protein
MSAAKMRSVSDQTQRQALATAYLFGADASAQIPNSRRVPAAIRNSTLHDGDSGTTGESHELAEIPLKADN